MRPPARGERAERRAVPGEIAADDLVLAGVAGQAVVLAGQGVRIATYGDMVRVPGTVKSLGDAQDDGVDDRHGPHRVSGQCTSSPVMW